MTETRQAVPQRSSKTVHEAYLVQIYPTGPSMGTRYGLGKESLVLGRAEDCEICIRDHSISRRHVRIEATPTGHYAVDMQSTNGTFVNDLRTTTARLRDGDYLRVGNCIFRFLSSANVEAAYHEEIYHLTIIDPLTGIPNKRYFLEFLHRELNRSIRHERPLGLIFFDIDHFKGINDELGHLGGDHTLRELAARLRSAIRNEELLARYGGEEFALVLVETGHPEAIETAERIRKLVEEKPFEFEGKEYHVTISLGVATTTGKEGWTATEFIRQADDKLYQAKRAGRNRVIA